MLTHENTAAATDHVAEHWPTRSPSDRFAWYLTKMLRLLADMMFRQHYMHRAVVLETVAAVPGMVGAMLQHLQSLRLMRARPEMVKTLLEEAENERMHLMAFVALCKPNWFERALILVAQGMFFNGFFLLYLVSAATAHRMIGYFEEEAVVSYTRFLKAIDDGDLGNCEIPAFAIDYWQLPGQAKLRDLVIAIRRDEMSHRDVNHAFSSDMQ